MITINVLIQQHLENTPNAYYYATIVAHGDSDLICQDEVRKLIITLTRDRQQIYFRTEPTLEVNHPFDTKNIEYKVRARIAYK